MKFHIHRRSLPALAALAGILFSMPLAAQRKPPLQADHKPIIFAVLNDGKMIEPIGHIDRGAMQAPVGGDDPEDEVKLFNSAYYKPNTVYRLIFGGLNNGTVTVKSSDHTADCSKNMAEVSYASARAKLAGKVFGLATNVRLAKPGSGVRRLPTRAERAEAERLVRAELQKQGNSAAVVKALKYHNLTALDVDGDGKIELVGSFWVEPNAKTRNTLFFIADKANDGKYAIGFGKYNSITEENVMSGEIATVDGGVYHELLLDLFDIDGDGVSEVFTYVQSFEGAGFNVYMRSEGKWNNVFEGSNYHCGY